MNGVLGHFYALSRLNWAGDAGSRTFIILNDITNCELQITISDTMCP